MLPLKLQCETELISKWFVSEQGGRGKKLFPLPLAAVARSRYEVPRADALFLPFSLPCWPFLGLAGFMVQFP